VQRLDRKYGPRDHGVPLARAAGNCRYVFVTPYYKETREYVERCIASVKRQTIRADHILISDGFPQNWIDQADVRHLRLDRTHQDYGNTPRGLGALMAVAEGYDGIGLLDADCWLEPITLNGVLSAPRGWDWRDAALLPHRVRSDGRMNR
jgi:GT2 family glycosyltransferase